MLCCYTPPNRRDKPYLPAKLDLATRNETQYCTHSVGCFVHLACKLHVPRQSPHQFVGIGDLLPKTGRCAENAQTCAVTCARPGYARCCEVRPSAKPVPEKPRTDKFFFASSVFLGGFSKAFSKSVLVRRVLRQRGRGLRAWPISAVMPIRR